MDERQLPSWLARGHQALQATIPPRTRKQFASLMLESGLWSSQRLSLDSAIARVGDCLHPDRGGGQSFKVSELWLWMHESGNHALFDAMAEDLNYRTEAIPTDQRQQELLQRVDERLAAVLSEISDLQAFRAQLTGCTQPAAPAQPGRLTAVRFSRDDDGREGF